MLIIGYDNGKESKYHEFNRTPDNILKIDYINATGNELTAILSHFVNIPCNFNNKDQFWFGDTAKFIIANLKL